MVHVRDSSIVPVPTPMGHNDAVEEPTDAVLLELIRGCTSSGSDCLGLERHESPRSPVIGGVEADYVVLADDGNTLSAGHPFSTWQLVGPFCSVRCSVIYECAD